MMDFTGNICAAVNKDIVDDILKNDYGFINGKIQQLDGYDDKNFYITVCINIKLQLKYIPLIDVLFIY